MVEDSLKSTNFAGLSPLFSEIQYFRSNKIIYFAYLALLGAVLAVVLEIKKIKERGFMPYPLFIVLFFVLLILFIMFLIKLKIEVNVFELNFSIFPFMIRPKRYKLSEIEKAEEITYRPLKEFGGWGIRYGKGMWAYTAYGNKGVLIWLKNGKRFLLGSQKPEELARSINRPI